MKRAKKPAILKVKVRLAMAWRTKQLVQNFSKHERGYWWSGVVLIKGRKVYVYFQYYVRRQGVDFVNITWEDTLKALTVKEINEALADVENK